MKKMKNKTSRVWSKSLPSCVTSIRFRTVAFISDTKGTQLFLKSFFADAHILYGIQIVVVFDLATNLVSRLAQADCEWVFAVCLSHAAAAQASCLCKYGNHQRNSKKVKVVCDT